MALVVVAVVGILALPTVGPGNGSLQRRFGPEYDRAVARHDGDVHAARRELSERLRRHGRLRARPLSAEERRQYEAKWRRIQERFVDSPGAALGEADHLLTQLLHDRGYPSDAREHQVAAVSVHHPRHVEAFRTLRLLAAAGAGGAGGTEELREALLRARDLFRDVLDAGPREAGAGRPDERRRLHVRRPRSRQDATTKGGV
ncbi:hypothetical protein D7319_31850 [Streptomyces radicis]|uniref:Secreted protein n=1 Tax=Streptomyces radicis TaxID=1750517 RepID=A0A3A9VQC9_9ACTN|nr:hypothetical protein D7319_31850 [Streptomyces radicis]RKN13173.1 hypothetical protein D7318_31625 [Streptomyces radicis]